MHVTERQPGDVDQLKELIRREGNAKQRNGYRIALLAIEGREKLEDGVITLRGKDAQKIHSDEVGGSDRAVLVMDHAHLAHESEADRAAERHVAVPAAVLAGVESD